MKQEWQYAIDAADIDEEDVQQAMVDNHAVAVYRFGGKFFATDDKCPHGGAYMSEGVVIDGIAECPLHQGRFCIQSGQPKGGPVHEPIRTFDTKVEGGRVFVRLACAK